MPRRWLDRIDVIAEGPGRRIFVYPVENGKAEDLANVLSRLWVCLLRPVAAEEEHWRTCIARLQGAEASLAAVATRQYDRFDVWNFELRLWLAANAAFRCVRRGANSRSGWPTRCACATAGSWSSRASWACSSAGALLERRHLALPALPQRKPEEQLRIVADPATNSLIVYGTAQEFQNIKNILKELDAVPRQVLLDVLVLEISLDDKESLGLDYEIRPGNTTFFDRTLPSRGGVLTGILDSLSGATPLAAITPFPLGVSGDFRDRE